MTEAVLSVEALAQRLSDFTETERRLARMYADAVNDLIVLRDAVERETTSLPMVRRRILGAVER